jgi:KaiC/GvpD/RAD55 family RecA-like ATPase/tetratricopeptide (TPR) repeat protein
VKTRDKAIQAYKQAASDYEKAEMPTHVAEAYWHTAQLTEEQGKYQETAEYYELASEAYKIAAKKIPQLEDFYTEYSLYMQAWSQIEHAKYSHSIEEYNQAKEYYKKSAEIHESTEHWSYLAPNYFAWANMEEAENLSRNEKIQQANQAFQEALQHFSNAEKSMKQKLEEITASDEKEMMRKLFESSDIKRKYCQTRMLMEEAKLLDRAGKYLQSLTKYREAAQTISEIVDKVDVEAEHKELEYLAILCRAWEKMADAEETSSAESYLDAAELFEEAKEYCFTKKASFWALGNCNFCKGLAAGLEYKASLDLANHSKAKGYIKNASTDYMQAGFKVASEYAKATLRLFDAYVFINQAEGEINQEKKVKHYQLAENLLQLAADSFVKAKQPEKTTLAQQMLENVREEKELAISFNEVLQAPTIASSTSAFSAPTSSSETSVGLENFEHANVQVNLVTQLSNVRIGESFCLSLEFVNAGREPALLMRVDDFVPSGFVVVKKPDIYRLEESCLNMKGKQLAPLKLVEVKLTLQASKKGQYQLNPSVYYLDELGQNKSLQLKTVEISVQEVIMEDRVSTGTHELDSLLLGGIPEEYAVVLSGPPCDERELLVKNFLKDGVEDGISFYVTTEATDLEDLLNNPNFFLFLCNPKPKTPVPDLPNVFKLQGKTDLTNLGIALIKAQRNIKQSVTNKRICVEILSDVLVKHRENTTREWISGLITNYGAKGFTMLAVMDPKEHPPDQATTVLNLFDGEISITQSDDPLDCKKSILIKKLRNQDYIKNPICLR